MFEKDEGIAFGELTTLLKKLLIYTTTSPEYWELKLEDVDTPITIPAGEKKDLVNVQEVGRVFAIVARANHPDLLVEVEIDDTVAKNTIKSIYDAGLIGFNPSVFWISRYDDTNNNYVAMFTPIPWRDYFSRIRVTVYAPVDSSVSVAYSVYRYRLKHARV